MEKSYPLYHTSYETFEFVNTYIDPGFKTSKLFGSIIAEIVYQMSSKIILPFNTSTYAVVLEREYVKFKNTNLKSFDNFGISLSQLEFAISNFTTVAHNFMDRFKLVTLDE